MGTDVAQVRDVMMKYVLLVSIVALPAIGALVSYGESVTFSLTGRAQSSVALARHGVPQLGSTQAAGLGTFFRKFGSAADMVDIGDRAAMRAKHLQLGGRPAEGAGIAKQVVFAHRNGPLDTLFPEHSLEGQRVYFERYAHDPNGAPVGEVDYWHTAPSPVTGERALVLFHDENLLRMTGIDKKIWELTPEEAAEVRLLDRDGNVTEHGIPTFEQMQELPQIAESFEAKSVEAAELFVEKFKAASPEWQQSYLKRATFFSQHPQAMRVLREGLGEHAVLGLSAKETSAWIWKSLPGIRRIVGPLPNAYRADIIAPPLYLGQTGFAEKVSKKVPLVGKHLHDPIQWIADRVPTTHRWLIEAAQENGIAVNTWTLNTDKQIIKGLRLADKDVDFYTDTPARVADLKKELLQAQHQVAE